MTTTTCPKPTRLQALVDSRLSPQDEAELTLHLETCHDCQDQLDTFAAGEQSWSAARELGRVEAVTEPALLRVMEQSLRVDSRGSLSEAARPRELSLDFLSPPREPEQLGCLGHYDVLEVIGQGGMGVALKAFDAKLQRTVAIKVLAPHLASSPTARERFVREAQAAAGIRDDHVIGIHAVEEAAELPYLVMDYIPGGSLQQRLNREGPLPSGEIVRIGLEAAHGLAAAHAKGLIHRDIKPANLLLDRDGRVKITDFGLAHAVDDGSLEGVVAGTPEYMSPEQARGEIVDPRADLFSLGGVLWALCTGQPPFAAGNTLAVLQRVNGDRPFPIKALNPAIPDGLIAIIDKLLAKDPAERFQTAVETVEALREQTTVARPPGHKGPGYLRFAVAAAVLLVGVAMVLPEIIIRIRDKDGKVTEHKVGEEGSVEIIENGKRVASISGGVRTAAFRRFTGHTEAVHDVTFSFDSKQVLSGSWDDKVRLWDIHANRELHCFDFAERGKDHSIFCVATSPDGRQVLAGAMNGRVWLLDLVEHKVLRHCDYPVTDGFGVNSVAFSADGRRALLGSYDGLVRVWDVGRWTEVDRIRHPHGLWSVDFSPDGRKVLTAGGKDNKSTLYLWDLNATKEPRVLKASAANGCWRAVFSPDGRFAASGHVDGNVRLWDLTTATEIRSFVHPDQVMGLSFTPDGKRLVTGCHDGFVRLWEVSSGHELHHFVGHGKGIGGVAVSRDGRYVAAAVGDLSVRVWELPK